MLGCTRVSRINQLAQATNTPARAGQTRLDRAPRAPHRFVENGHVGDFARQAEGAALSQGRRATANSDVPVRNSPRRAGPCSNRNASLATQGSGQGGSSR